MSSTAAVGAPARPQGGLSDGLRPPLKWAGGKRWQVPHLLPFWQSHQSRRLVEPFCGGLAVALGLRPRAALLNDVNPHLVNFYSWLKTGFRSDIEMKNSERHFYRARTRFNLLLSKGRERTAEAAGLFYYLNRTGYNGLCRFNQSGAFNVPFGRYKSITYTSDFSSYASVFADWEFIQEDFENVPLRSQDFVYADPPYDVEFTSYSKGGFSWRDQIRTAEWLARHKGPVILVNQATERIRDLYRTLGYKERLLTAPRMINSTGDRTPAQEILATRNL